MSKNEVTEVLRSHCRYHATFAVVWLAFALLSIRYKYAWSSALDGFLLCYHLNRAWGAYQTATLLSDDRIIEINADEEKEDE